MGGNQWVNNSRERDNLVSNTVLAPFDFQTPSATIQNDSFISISSQHLFCNNCDNDVETVSSLTFKISNVDGVKEFTLPPASSIELTQLAMLFGVCHAFSSKVVFSTLPGFEISFLRDCEDSVQVTFSADKEILTFMGLSTSCSSVMTTIAIADLETIETSIRNTLFLCQK